MSSLPEIAAPPRALGELHVLSDSWPAWFSCNAAGDVWPSHPRFGWTRPSERQLVTGQSVFLDDVVVPLVLSCDAGGGRFYVDDVGVYLADGDVQIAVFTRRRPQR